MPLVPMVLEQDGRSERSFDLYSRMLRERIVFVKGEVEDEMSTLIVAQLLFLEAEDREKPINMYVNSPGGVVTAGLAIIDTMHYIKPPVRTICVGQAASMGAMILSAGEKGMRLALPHARIMCHQPSGGARGMASDIKIQYEEIQRLKDMLNGMLVASTGRSLDDVERIMDRDTFFGPEQAKDFGLIDKIVTRHA